MNDQDRPPENPYEAPVEPDLHGPPRGSDASRKSTWPTVLGVLSCIFGGAGILLTIFSIIMVFVVQAIPQPGGGDATMELMRKHMVATIAFNVIYIALQSVLLAIGIGLFRRAPWVRSAALIWSGCKIAYSVSQTVWTIPMMREQMRMMYGQDSDLPEDMGGFIFVAQMVGLGIGLVWACALPVFFLIFLNRKKVKDEVASW